MAISPAFPRMPAPVSNAELFDKLTKLEILMTPLLIEGFQPRRGRLHAETPYPIFNPTTLITGDEVVFVSRTTSRVHRMDGLLDVPSGEVQTANIIHRSDRDFSRFSHGLLDEADFRKSCHAASLGLEDLRLFRWKGSVWGIGSGVRRTADSRPAVSQVLVRIEDDKIVEFFVLASPFDFAIEKNWMPLVQGEQLFFIYSLLPQIILEFRNGGVTVARGERVANNRFHLCGGTGFIAFGNQFLAVGHLRDRINGKQFYRHFFVVMDQNLKYDEISEPFFIQRRGVEFACGLSQYGEDLLLSYGVADRASYYCVVPRQHLSRWIVA